MAERRRYTKRQKVTAVIAAEASSLTAAAEQTGIPMRTIAHWREKPELAALASKTREEMAEGMKVIAQLAANRLVTLIPTMDARDLTVLLGVATDKGLLLSGEATARIERKDITNDLDDHEREQLAKVLREAVERSEVTG